MNWRNFDLNLLVVFDAVAQARSVTQAAATLNMSQSAVSHALTRLRTALKDELFIRQSDSMEPTPYAADLADLVRAALESLGPELQGATAFDPALAERKFSIAVDNRSALVLAAPIAGLCAVEAPRVTLNLVPSGTLDVVKMLDRGEIDLALVGADAPDDRFVGAPLIECGFAALVRRGHPAGRNGKLGVEELGAYPHLLLSSTGEGTEFIDEWMAGAGLVRRVACKGPLLSAPAVLVQSDMIAIMGELGAREFARAAPLEVLALPFETPRLRTMRLSHRRYDDVPAHRWLRDLVQRAAKTV
ncbi:LysR family transcriptional regulator [Methylobacterium brachythecii]|uniref:DNA-binding transcriptional LysR family regulator n=1 Tax=Methylobacterium brachythecii TaxID=1176177 RepID=A0A7W6F8U5_9HYPH|nr:LysR family transcriptional regulator [Methylobacterium brachythecii]MBB3904790.1 DNA-binding transcriptional LysR family regulator [Methylobacterium brachythecii]GLS45343.1 LysR family transcriptional regulator [Methylobacterium brachythecii]